MNEENLQKLKTELYKLNMYSEDLKEKTNVFKKENETLIGAIQEVKNKIEELKSCLRENAEAGFAKDGIKKRLGGIGIRETTKLNYDSKVAFKWATEHKLCLSLDTKSFETLAKTNPLDFVTEETKITVTFPKEIIL